MSITEYEIAKMVNIIREQNPAMASEFEAKVITDGRYIVEIRGNANGLVPRLTNDPLSLADGPDGPINIPEGTYFFNWMDTGPEGVFAGKDLTVMVKTFLVIDTVEGTICDKTNTLETIQ